MLAIGRQSGILTVASGIAVNDFTGLGREAVQPAPVGLDLNRYRKRRRGASQRDRGAGPRREGSRHARSYGSSNGGRWTLIRDNSSRRLFVRHEANPSSGGRVTDTDARSPERRRERNLSPRHSPLGQP
jgi:hypothetical protein